MDNSAHGVFVPLTPDQSKWLEATAAEMNISVEALLCTAAAVDETIAYIDASNKRINAMLASSPMP